MKRFAGIVVAIVLAAGLAAAMTPKEIDAFLRNHAEEGYRFIRSSGENIWYIAFRLPDWTAEWSAAVVFITDDSGAEFLMVGTTVGRTAAPPSPALMKLLLEKNNDDLCLGCFSIYADKEYSVQYSARVPNRFLTADGLLYYIGFVTGYCNKAAPEIAKLLGK